MSQKACVWAGQADYRAGVMFCAQYHAGSDFGHVMSQMLIEDVPLLAIAAVGRVGRSGSSNSLVAPDATSGRRLSARLTAEEIAGGHAFDKHVVGAGQFPGIRTRPEFADMIENTIENYQDMRTLERGRTAYWRDGVVVIRNPGAPDGGTAFVPNGGYSYFRDDLD